MFEKFGEYLKLSGVSEILRRYFVMNAFDGVLTMVGVIIGASMAGVLDGKLIIGAGIGASLAMGISGASGAYLTEKAERKRKLKELESAMLRDLDDTSHGRAARFSYIFASLVDGLSPALGAMLVVSPFFFLPAETAVSTSLTIAFLLLFSLGAYLGKICEEKIWWYGIQMLLIGFLTVLIIYSAGMMI